jgi:hypothetical protein
MHTVKKYSNKPLWVTTRDAAIVTIISVAITLIITWIWYLYSATPAAQRTYGSTLLQASAISMASQYVYEYTGFNAMIAESSIRYSKGTTLEKYAKSRAAMLWDIYSHIKDPSADVEKRLHQLQYIIAEPYESVHKKPPEELGGLTEEELRVISVATVEMDEDMIRDMLEHGFDGWRVESGILGDTVLPKQ